MSPISNASRLADFGSGIGTQGAIIQVDNTNQRVGIGTTNKISSGNILTVGMLRFPNQTGKNWTGNFILRSVFKYSHPNIEPTKNIISEIGYSMGFGFKFGATSNQLDINYYVGSRSFKEKFDGENIHQIQAGVSLSDIWFVKRRQKK